MEAAFIDQRPTTTARPGAADPVRHASRPRKILLGGRIASVTSPSQPELEMAALARTLPGLGMAARLWRPWEDSLSEFDCLHLFGSAPEHLSMLEAARQANLRVALTPMLWYDLPERTCQRRSLVSRLASIAERVRQSVCPGWHSWRHELYESVDLILPNSNAEAQHIMRHFRVPAERIQIVPHAADASFANADAEAFAELYGLRHFVLLAGSIEPRNCQISFLWALSEMDVPVVVLGDVAAGCEWYFEECRRAATDRVRFVPHMDHDDPLRASAYAACSCLVLGGGFETSAQAALEAGMAGAPLVLPEQGYASEYFGQQAIYVRSDDPPAMRRAIRMALGRGRSTQLAEHIRTYYSWNAAGRVLRQSYHRLLAASVRKET